MKEKITCLIRGKEVVKTPEEIVRQDFIAELIEHYNYSKDQIAVEVGIKMGSTIHKKRADIVVYEDTKKLTPKIIIENKKKNRRDGLDQLHSYMNATGVIFGVWTNGDHVFQLKENVNRYRVISNIPKDGETLEDIDNPLIKSDLRKIEDLVSVIKDCENEIALQQGVDFFNEIFKIIFTKLYDEKTNLSKDTSKCEFRIKVTDSHKKSAESIKKLFSKAKTKWKGIFDDNEEIKLNDYNIAYTASALENYHLIGSNIDVIGTAFETMVNPDFKGELGQYFTPRQVVKACVEMLNPKEDETVFDPACGSGGFLVYALDHVYKTIDQKWDNPVEVVSQQNEYAQRKIFGLDYDPRLVKVCKAYMLIWGDGRSNIYWKDSIDSDAWDTQIKQSIKDIDIIFTNPPFSGDLKKPEVLSQFDLSYKGDPSSNKIQNKVTKPILMLEQCYRVLKPGGRLCIVLPQGILNNLNDDYIRDFLKDKFRILGIVGLEQNTFKPFTTPKTSLLFLQKYKKTDIKEENYEVFIATSKFSGKDKRGNNVYEGQELIKGFRVGKDPENANVEDIKTDLYEISQEFIKFCKKQKLDFF